MRGRVDSSDSDEVLLIGDFNADSSDARGDEVFGPWIASPDRYRVLSKALDDGGAVTFLPADIMLDHMIATRALDDELGAETPFIPALDAPLGGYETRVSDHLPLVLRLPILD